MDHTSDIKWACVYSTYPTGLRKMLVLCSDDWHNNKIQIFLCPMTSNCLLIYILSCGIEENDASFRP